MALAEARAACQRTANRYLVQEDAKRAPKLASRSSSGPCNKPAVDSSPTCEPPSGQYIPSTLFSPFELNPSCPNLSPNTRWWLQLQPSYGCQKSLADGNPSYRDCSFETTNLVQETMQICTKKEDDSDVTAPTTYYESSFGYESCNNNKVEKMVDDCLFDSESSSMGSGKNVPWWRTADTEELASFVSQSSIDFIENCDLPSPRNVNTAKDFSINKSSKVFASPLDHNLGTVNQNPQHFDKNAYTPTKRSVEINSYKRLRMAVGSQQVASASDKPLSPKSPDTHKLDDEASKAKLLEALRHSQTRAREAEKVAKQAREEKEHIIKLVIRQASELFAYKQWIQLLQLENMYYNYISNATQSISTVFPVMLPLKRKKKVRKNSPCKKRTKRSCSWFDPCRFRVLFTFGMGLICAGFLLGWSIGWMIPAW